MTPLTTSPSKTVWKHLSRFVLVILVFTSACASSEEPTRREDYELTTAFSGESVLGCDLICWFGIQVGTTSGAQALELIKQAAWIDQSTLESSDDKIKVSWFTETTKEFRSYAQLNLDAGIVDSIEITGLTPFTTGDFIKLLGEPNELGITSWRGAHGEGLTSYVLYYTGRNLELYIATGSPDGPQPNDFVSMVGTELVFQGQAKQKPWLGYGQLDKYLAP
jgi:hypothetical protein